MNDLKPFCKLVWNSVSLADEWSNVLAKAQDISFQAEYEMVRQGLREANVYHMYPNAFDKQIEQITEDGLVFLPILRSRTYNGFSHQHYPTEVLDSNSFVFGVVAENLEAAKRFRNASKSGDHVTQGLMLGYPECCSKFFTESWTKQKALDPCYETALNTLSHTVENDVVNVEGHPYLNQMLRYFGLRITPFFPCSFNCQEAIQVGEAWHLVMKCIDEDTTDKIMELLSQPLSWSLYKGIIEIKTPLFRGIVNGYSCDKRKELRWTGKMK